MERSDFLKMLGFSGAALAVGSHINIDDKISPEVQDKLMLLRNEILSMVKDYKPKWEFTITDDRPKNIGNFDNHYETEFGHVFSVKSIAYNMRYLIRYEIMNGNLDWWHQDWDINDFVNKKDIVVLWSKKSNLFDFLCEMAGIIEENKKLLSNFEWYDNQKDYLRLTIARCYLLMKDFDNAEMWYNKCSENEREDIESDYKLFALPIPKFKLQGIRMYQMRMSLINKSNINEIVDKYKDYSDIVRRTNNDSQIKNLN